MNVLILSKGAYRNEKVERDSFSLGDRRFRLSGRGFRGGSKRKEAHKDELYR